MEQHPLELLAPARDLSCGIAAINHGADSVYIGGPRFGARAAASNSLRDIAKLVRYGHQFFARVYVTLNTILTDRELEEATDLVRDLYNLGVDALIIQDMGLLECDLPPIPLHASTQTDNRTVEQVRFLEQVGFQQVVLARELSLAQIRAIRSQTTVPLECFVHGALCVSYSGRCYISEVMTGRSANRGECAQFCRHRFSLKDGAGRVVAQDRYLLSLKDLDLSAQVAALVDAGVSSLKIEGRLKGEAYVKNVTAAYRLIVDKLLTERPELARLSSGHCRFAFVPDTTKSFNRGQTEYFLRNRHNRPAALDTPKSIGQRIGTVQQVAPRWFSLQTGERLHNGDGLCYVDASKQLIGFLANRVEGNKVFHRTSLSLQPGTVIYRNYDADFVKQLQQSANCRFLSVDLQVVETPAGLSCLVQDADGCRSQTELAVVKERARRIGDIADRIERQMRKSGSTVFQVEQVSVHVDAGLHVPASAINALRRKTLAAHLHKRQTCYHRSEAVIVPNKIVWPGGNRATYRENITNSRARAFYRRHGVTEFMQMAGGPAAAQQPALMTCKYCIKAQLSLCAKIDPQCPIPQEPLVLCDNSGEYLLEFDCHRCEMIVRRAR